MLHKFGHHPHNPFRAHKTSWHIILFRECIPRLKGSIEATMQRPSFRFIKGNLDTHPIYPLWQGWMVRGCFIYQSHMVRDQGWLCGSMITRPIGLPRASKVMIPPNRHGEHASEMQWTHINSIILIKRMLSSLILLSNPQQSCQIVDIEKSNSPNGLTPFHT